MKTEFERISEIMYTLLEHQPVIDVPYEKINDIAVALVKEGYGKVSEYETEREMLGSQIKVLKQRLNNKYVEIDNLNRDYSNAFERLKAQQREIERLKNDYAKLQEQFAQYQMASDKEIKAQIKQAQDNILSLAQQNQEYREQQVKQAQIDVLNRVMTYINDKIENNYGDMSDSVNYLTINIDDFDDFIDELIKEVQDE